MNKQPLMASEREKILTLDVREDIRNGREPFSKIMKAVVALPADAALLLIAPFEPAPLFGVLEKKGFQHEARPLESGDWEVLFSRPPTAPPAEATPIAASCDFSNRTAAALPPVTEVDARGLEPPQPMVIILEALAVLPVGTGLHARTDRRPMHLYPQLEERGFTAETLEQTDGSFLIRIRHR
jgi:uncharacterized protein (DUF2249 family)